LVKNSILKAILLKYIRISNWWNYIFPPILGVAYFSILLNQGELGEKWVALLLFFISFVFTASFGYFLNDICDIEIDKKASKQNFAQKLPVILRYLFLFFLLLFAVLPWLFFENIHIAKYFYILQIILLFAYSLPYIRLKSKIFAAVITDALYSSLLPAIIAFSLFTQGIIVFEIVWFFLLCTTILFLRGLRNILIHQIIDAENDKKTGTKTFAIVYGEQNIYMTLSFFFLPIEIIMILFFCVFLALKIGFAWLIFPLLVLFYAIKIFDAKAEKNKILKIQIINDFYEDIFPVFILILLTFIDYYYLIILFAHVIVFRNKVAWLILPWLYYKMFFNKYIRKVYVICGLIKSKS